ncbi:MAG: InlB B-repeat-containing protein, partial [Clostridiaceae bacterium]|nr:InlB B-repeat-containing protein [Clostridiaceae bacterium]
QFTNSSTYKYVEIIECFDVYAGGVKVSGIESGNISYWLNDSSGAITDEGTSAESYNVKYNEGSNTLTLNDADITSYHEISDSGGDIRYGIYSSSELNLRLNSSTNNSVGISDEDIGYGVFAYGTLTVGGEGALALVGNDGASQTGICGVNGITIAGGEVTVSNVSYGITANNGSITVSGGVTNVSASVFGLLSNNRGTTISGGTTIAIGASRAFYTLGSFSVNMPSYIYKTNTEPLAPATSYDLYPDTPFAAANIADYKYVTISSKCAIIRSTPENGSFTVSVDGVTVSEAWPGDTVTLAATPDSHYLLSFWDVYRRIAPTATVDVYADSFIMPPYHVTVEASFTPETYTITYYQNDGSGSIYITQTNVPYGNTLAAPTAPTRGGYTFNGWYKESACVNLWNFASETVTDATSLYAKWTENSSDDDGGRSYTVPSRTITVSKTSSNMFSGSIGTITAEANMEKAFSNSVEVKVKDTNEDAASFGLGVGN